MTMPSQYMPFWDKAIRSDPIAERLVYPKIKNQVVITMNDMRIDIPKAESIFSILKFYLETSNASMMDGSGNFC